MADQERDKGRDAASPGANDNMSAARRARQAGQTIGRGMTSPDSTEAVLSAETGEPDERARGDGGQAGGGNRGDG